MKIKSISKIENKSKRYDVQTKTGNFFANGILVHNSLISVWHYNGQWHASTRKMGYAEGQTSFGNTFAKLFWNIANKYELKKHLDSEEGYKEFTFIFELVSIETRVVTPYENDDIIIIGARYNKGNMRELSDTELYHLSESWGIRRPKTFNIDRWEELLAMIQSFPSMEEGVVLVVESQDGSHKRIKVKNPKFVAIANMRNNGNISPRRILLLIMENEHHEYLRYFACDQKYFDFVENVFKSAVQRIKNIYEETKDIKDQKEFALTIIPKTIFSFEKGVLFSIRKNGTSVEDEVIKLEPKKLADGMNLRKKFAETFGVQIEEEESVI
jgi:hypothetical protein